MMRGRVGRRQPQKSRRPHLRKIICTTGLFLGILLLSAVGGYLNRARGGAVHPDGDYWFQHVMSRLMFGLPTAAIVGMCALSWRPFVVVALLTSVSLIIGWGCYFDVTTQQHGWTSRQGVFDWLIGRQEEGWPPVKVMYHNYAGMALRGLAWTAPQGYILYHMGYGWHFSMTGCLMSVPYSFGWFMRSYSWMAAGQPWSETIWGYWIWVVSITSAMAGLLEQLRENSTTGHGRHVPFYLSSFISNRWLAILFEVWNAALTVIFLCSTVFYAMVQQLDVKNKGQTFFGLFFVTVVLLAAQAVVFTSVWLTKRKDIDLTYELRGVAILCQSPLILRNKVHFSPSRFRSRRPSESGDRRFDTYQHSLASGESTSSPSINQTRELFFESSRAAVANSPGAYHPEEDDDSQDNLSVSTDTDSEDVDWSMLLSEPSTNVLVQLRKLPYRVWVVAEGSLYTSFPAMFRLVQGVLALLGCLVVFYMTTSAVLWNLNGPRFLHICACSQ